MSSLVLAGDTSGSITVSSPAVAGTNTLTLPAATDTLVGKATTDTLTNKTLTTPNINSAQVATVSGTAPLYMCRAWVNFNGTGTVAIRASGNVSSITDNGTGDYTINFTTAMPDINYTVVGQGVNPASWTLGPQPFISSPSLAEVAPTTSAVRLVVGNNSGSFLDAKYVCYAIFR
jgi:hypothetical protein